MHTIMRVTTFTGKPGNLEKSGEKGMFREKSGINKKKSGKCQGIYLVRENFLHNKGLDTCNRDLFHVFQ
jgi:hypothetical protein